MNVTPFRGRPAGPPTDLPDPVQPEYDQLPDVPRIGQGDGQRMEFTIDVDIQSLKTMSGTAWASIKANNTPPTIFRSGDVLVRLDGGEGAERAVTRPLGVEMMSHLTARTAFWYKQRKGQGFIEQYPPERVMKDLLVDPAPPVPALNRIVQAPVFGRDRTLTVQPGYAPTTGNFYDANGLAVAAPPETPTEAEVTAALSLLLDDLLGDFAFVGEADAANALALMLNPFVRDLIDGPTPLHLIEAPVAGTGKGLLAATLMLPALGERPTLMPPSTNEEETRKRLMATAMALPSAVLIDNVAETIDSPSLSAMLTAHPYWTDRVLGKSETRRVPVTMTWMATGNNPSRSREMARRIATIRLDSNVERPEMREGFRHENLIEWATEHRGELVTACLTLVQAWIARGANQGKAVMGSFEAWARIHSGILSTCGVEGFLTNRERADAITVSDDLQWIEFVNRWWARHHDAVVGTAELFPIAEAMPEFPLGDKTDQRSQRMSLGRSLSRNADRIFDGLQITHVGEVRRAAQYRLRWMRAESPI